MGNVVEFSVNMLPITQIRFGPGEESKLVIRLAALHGHEDNLPPEIRVGNKWAWAIIQERPGKPSKLIIGGQADSMTTATAQAQLEYERQVARYLRPTPKKGS